MNDRSSDKKHQIWAQKIKERAGYRCELCKTSGVLLHSHHLNSYDLFVEERYDLNNGICLCSRDHLLYHSIFGRGQNTKNQFEQFKISYQLIKKAIIKESSEK